MTLSDTHRDLIQSLDGRSCLASTISTYRPHAPEFAETTFISNWIFMLMEWSTSGRLAEVRVLETDTQIIITTCDEGTDATIETYIFTK